MRSGARLSLASFLLYAEIQGLAQQELPMLEMGAQKDMPI
jgi:hypothetical protein